MPNTILSPERAKRTREEGRERDRCEARADQDAWAVEWDDFALIAPVGVRVTSLQHWLDLCG